MKHQIARIFVVFFLSSFAWAQTESSFTYQGELRAGGGPADGSYDFTFTLFDAAVGGTQHGAPVVANNHPVTDGLFEIELDYGVDALGVENRWLEIGVNGDTLSPRTRITSSPYSVQTRGFYVADNGRVSIGQGVPQADFHFQGINDVYPEIRIGNNAGSYSTFDENLGSLNIEKYVDGESVIELNPISGFNSARKYVDFFKQTVALGGESGASVRFYRGDGSSNISALISASNGNGAGDSFFQAFGGNFGIGTSTPGQTLDVAGDGMFRNRLGVGNPSSFFGQLSIADSGDGAPMAISADSTNAVLPTIFASNSGGGPSLWALGTNDASLAGGGLIVAGVETGANISIDQNEIMARNGGAASELFLNNEGGQISLGEHQMHPAHAYGKLRTDGTLHNGSSNIISTARLSEGTYEVVIEGGILFNDIAVCSGVWGGVSVGGEQELSGTALRISAYDLDDNKTDAAVQFVVYRP